jgi:hypothetical protein
LYIFSNLNNFKVCRISKIIFKQKNKQEYVKKKHEKRKKKRKKNRKKQEKNV